MTDRQTPLDHSPMYELRAPADDLSPFIEHYWFVTPDVPLDLRVDVFVDARADLIFNYGAPYVRELIGGEAREITCSNLDAQRMSPIRITQRGQVEITGVRFRLGGLGAFARCPLVRVTNKTVSPSDVLGDAANALEADLPALSGSDTRARRLDAFFRDLRSSNASFEQFERVVRFCEETHGTTSVEAMANTMRVSTRHIERLFAKYLGITPKTLNRVLRFQRALRTLMQNPACTLAEVATSVGYFDQAHFIKDFRRMSGGLPRGYRGYFPTTSPTDFAPNVVVFLQDAAAGVD